MWYNKAMKAGYVGIIICAVLILLGSCGLSAAHDNHTDHHGCTSGDCECAHTCRCAVVQDNAIEIDLTCQSISLDSDSHLISLFATDIFRPPQPLS
jgi:hypothetical protein